MSFEPLYWLIVTIITVINSISVGIRLNSLKKKLNERSNNNSITSTTSTTIDEKQKVDMYKYSRVTLPRSTSLRPTTREGSAAATPNDYYVQTQESIEVRLGTSIAVSYDGTELVVVGNSDSPYVKSKPALISSTFASEKFRVQLNEGTKIAVSETHDQVGLLRRLEADQNFKIMPGSIIIVPAGCEVYLRDDVNRHKFLTRDSICCTLIPPLKNDTLIDTCEKNETATITTRK